MYDIIIIGAGTAGLTAGIYSARAKRKTLILDRKRPGGQAATTERMENYPGFPDGIRGRELLDLFARQAEKMGSSIERHEVSGITVKDNCYAVHTKDSREFLGKAVILAPGCQPRRLGIPGEEAYSGRGVSYCATCDAEIYEEAKIIVIGSGDTAVEEAVYLSRFADEVAMVVVHDEGTLDCNRSMAEEAMKNEKLTWRWNRSVTAIEGDDIVTGVRLKNLKTGEEEVEECEGVFMFVGTVPQTAFLEGFVSLNRGYIVTNEKMETNVPRIYGAGDGSATNLRQVVTAAADGAKAAFFADKALCEEEDFQRAVSGAGNEYLIYFYTPPVQKSLDMIPDAEKKAADTGLALVKFDTFRFRETASGFGVTEVPKLLKVKKGADTEELDF